MKTVDAAEASSQFETLLAELRNGTDAIVIEDHGRLHGVLVSEAEWARLLDAKECARRLEAWDDLLRLRNEVRAMNEDLDVESADRLAAELGDEAMSRVVARARSRWNERSG